jgi:DNA-binding NarL/FixJ family response regulator
MTRNHMAPKGLLRHRELSQIQLYDIVCMSPLECMPVRVLIADDAEVIRKAIRDLLASERTIEVCGEARTFSETLDLATSLKPDVILLDLHMPDSESPESEFVKFKLLSTSSRIVAISLWQDEETKIIAQGYRAVQLLDKAKLCDELIPAIQRVSRQHS